MKTCPFDLQINGFAGVDFCSAQLTEEDLAKACSAISNSEVDSILVTIITDSVDRLCAKLSRLANAIDNNASISSLVRGIHLEGPFLSDQVGFIGTHDADHVGPATLKTAKRLFDSALGHLKLVTLAPEQDPTGQVTRFFRDNGVVVSAGHCDPSLDQLKLAIDHGLSMVTHFGNAVPLQLARHNNVLQRYLACREYLWFCFIADGHHIPFFALKNYIECVGSERSIMVTDAISAAGLGPGSYRLSDAEVEVDQTGAARKSGSEYLAGSTLTMPQIKTNLATELSFDEEAIKRMIDDNPRSALGISGTTDLEG